MKDNKDYFKIYLQEQCFSYWDDKNDITFDQIVVKVNYSENNLVYIKRKFEVSDLVNCFYFHLENYKL